MNNLSVFYMPSEEVVIEAIYGYSLDTVLAALADIQASIEDMTTDEDFTGILGKQYIITNIHYNESQVGNYSPPNVEAPGYWDMRVTFLHNVVEEDEIPY